MTGDAVRQARERAPQTKELIYAVSERLQWNVNAYGKAWTGEDEDTEFIVAPLADAVETLTEKLEHAADRAVCSGCGQDVDEGGGCHTDGCDDGEMIPASDIPGALREKLALVNALRDEHREEVETLTRERDEARKALTAFSAASLVVCPLCEAVDVSEAEISTCGESECPLRVYRAALAAVEAGAETPVCGDVLDRAVLLANEVSPVLAAEIAALGSESTACPGDA